MDELLNMFFGFIADLFTALGNQYIATGVTIAGVIIAAFLLIIVIRNFTGGGA